MKFVLFVEGKTESAAVPRFPQGLVGCETGTAGSCNSRDAGRYARACEECGYLEHAFYGQQRMKARKKWRKSKPQETTTQARSLTAGIKTGAHAEESDAAIKRLVEAGLLRPATKPWRMPELPPRPIRGPSIAQAIREERDDS